MIETNTFLLAFVVLYIGQSAFQIWLDSINLGYSRKQSGRVPAGFEDFVDAEKLSRMNDYTAQRGRMGIFEETASQGVLLAVLLSGLLPLLVEWFETLGLSLIPAGILFFLAPAAIQLLVELPFGYYNTFVVEQRFGFNRSTLRLWIVDHLKSVLISLALFVVLFSILMLLIEHSPGFWWFWGFLTVLGAQVILAVLFPVVIAPLFNKFEPVKDEELAGKIMRLMEENGIRVKKILQMNAGMRSRHTNAYFTGIGKTKQIVLFDTLIDSHTHEEILAVLAHEAGHFRRKHVLKQLALFGAFTLAGFYITYWFIRWPLPYSTFGFETPAPYVGLFLAGVLWQKAGFFLQPLYMWISRRFEEEADDYSAGMIGAVSPMISALKRLASDNLSNLNPHPLYVRFHYSHPPIVRRVARLNSGSRRREGTRPSFIERPHSP